MGCRMGVRAESTARPAAGRRLGVTALLLLAGCTAMHGPRPRPEPAPVAYTEKLFAAKEIASYVVPTDARGKPEDTVIGAATTYEIRPGDTLLDVARYHDLGYNEIVAANPGVDPWIPEAGTEIVLPTEWVLPCCSYEGIVVNIPEMRLYQYRRSKDAPGTVTVHTHPVGLGRDDRRTPRGTFRVSGKTVNPTWYIPESIRREHIKERGDHRRAIAGGADDNPLGKHRISLASSLYAIHGTNIPWGVGMMVSHGCLRLYPEDIERLFPRVAVGTPVRFVYQPVKVGARAGETWVEVHEDVYRYARSLSADAQKALSGRAGGGRVDRELLEATVRERHGVPVRVESAAPAARDA